MIMSLITLVAVEMVRSGYIKRVFRVKLIRRQNVVGADEEDFRSDSLASDVKKSGR